MSALLGEIGYADALIARDTPDGLVLIDGHLRAETTPDSIVPVLVLDVTEDEADKLLLTLDPLAAMAEADKGLLADLLGSVQAGDVAVTRLLDDLAKWAHVNTAKGGLTDTDAVPPTPDEPATKPGDLWLLGEHRLLCGDATKAEDVARLRGWGMAAAMWTDPPYGVEYTGGTLDALTIQNDGADGLAGLLAGAFEQATRAIEPGSPFYIARPQGALSVTFGCAILGAGWKLHEELQWVKDSMVLGHSDYHVRHETVVYGWTPGPGRSGRGKHEGTRWYGDNSQTSVFEIPRPKASPDHPTVKPVELVERCLANSTQRGDVVYDPFLGSGTTLIACERLARRCYAMEIDPRYVDVAVRRWEQYTGQKAVLDG